MPSTEWYVAVDGAPEGPLPLAALQAAAASGVIDRSTLVWTSGLAAWQRADEVEGLFATQEASASDPATTGGAVIDGGAHGGDRSLRGENRLGVWAFLALSGMHALGAFGSLFLKTGLPSYDRLTTEQAFVAATNDMAVAVAFLAIAYLYEAKGHVVIPILGLLAFGAEVLGRIGTGEFAPVWLIAYTALALLFAASVKLATSRRRSGVIDVGRMV